MVIFREQLKEKVVDYDLEAYRKSKGESVAEERKPEEDLGPMLPGMEDAR
jgi:hypothetical protein